MPDFLTRWAYLDKLAPRADALITITYAILSSTASGEYAAEGSIEAGLDSARPACRLLTFPAASQQTFGRPIHLFVLSLHRPRTVPAERGGLWHLAQSSADKCSGRVAILVQVALCRHPLARWFHPKACLSLFSLSDMIVLVQRVHRLDERRFPRVM